MVSKGGGRDKLGVGIRRCTLPYIKQVINKDLLYSTGNYIHYIVINYNGKESKKKNIDIYV